jgi:hypothetical protein
MNDTKDGGSAFPRQFKQWDNDCGEWVPGEPEAGMTLRDYFAIHGEEPSQIELLDAGGMVQGEDGIYARNDGQTKVAKSFYEWFNKQSNEQRFALCAKVRFLMADAMLKARHA